MPSSGACIPVPSFFGSAEVWPSRLVKLNVRFSLCMCVRAVLACVYMCVCVCVCVCVCGVCVWCVCGGVVLHFLFDCCLLEHA